MPTSYCDSTRPHVFRHAGSFEIIVPQEDGSEDAVSLTTDDLVNIVVGGELALRDLSLFNHEDGPRVNPKVTERLEAALVKRRKL